MSNIKKIIVWVGNGVGKQVRPTYEWKPDSSRTLIYYPLTSNLVDQMWNWNTGTMHWTCTYNSSTWIYVTGRSSNYVTWLSNGIANRNVFTLCVWFRYSSLSWSSNIDNIMWYANNSQTNQAFDVRTYPNNTITAVVVGRINATISNPRNSDWHNLVITADWTTYKVYDKWVLIKSESNSNAVQNYSELQLWWWWNYTSWRSANGYIKDYIVENYAWSEEEITNYYNSTKSTYWL